MLHVFAEAKLAEVNPLATLGKELHRLHECIEAEAKLAWHQHAAHPDADYRIRRAIDDYEEALPNLIDQCRYHWALFAQPDSDLEALIEKLEVKHLPAWCAVNADEVYKAAKALIGQLKAIAPIWRKLAFRLDGLIVGFEVMGTHSKVNRSMICIVWVPKAFKPGAVVMINGKPYALTKPQHDLLHFLHKCREKNKAPTLAELEKAFHGARNTLKRLEARFEVKLVEHLDGYGAGYRLN